MVKNSDPGVMECIAGITDFRDSMELAYARADSGTGMLLMHAGARPQEFLQLSTGFAGEFVQRLVSFRLRTAAVFDPAVSCPERFRGFLLEARRHPQSRAFDSRAGALAWLVASAVQAGTA